MGIDRSECKSSDKEMEMESPQFTINGQNIVVTFKY